MDVCKCRAVHLVDEQTALQVIHLVLDDPGCPPARLPRDRLTPQVQPYKASSSSWAELSCISQSQPPFPNASHKNGEGVDTGVHRVKVLHLLSPSVPESQLPEGRPWGSHRHGEPSWHSCPWLQPGLTQNVAYI